MAVEFVNPLTEEHLTAINNGLDAAQIARVQIEMAKRAGIDVSTHEQQLNANEQRLMQLKQVYFPGR